LDDITRLEAEISTEIASQRRYEMPIGLKQQVSGLIETFDTTYNDFYPDRQPIKKEFEDALQDSLKAMGYVREDFDGKMCYVRPRKDTREVDVLMPHQKEYFAYHLLSEKNYQKHRGLRRRGKEPTVRLSNIVAGTVAGTAQIASIVLPGLIAPPLAIISVGAQFVVGMTLWNNMYSDDPLDATLCNGTYQLMKKALPEKENLEGVVKRLGVQPFALVKYEGTAALKKALQPAKGYEFTTTNL